MITSSILGSNYQSTHILWEQMIFPNLKFWRSYLQLKLQILSFLFLRDLTILFKLKLYWIDIGRQNWKFFFDVYAEPLPGEPVWLSETIRLNVVIILLKKILTFNLQISLCYLELSTNTTMILSEIDMSKQISLWLLLTHLLPLDPLLLLLPRPRFK